MPYNFSRTADTINLELVGEIDLEITADLKNQLLAEIENGKNLRINGSEVSYIDSSGISVLIIAMQNCNKKDVNFSIQGASDELLRVIKMAHLDKLLPIETQKKPVNMSQDNKTDANESDMDAFIDNDDSIAKELADLSISTNESAEDETQEPLEEALEEPLEKSLEEAITDTQSDSAADMIQDPIDEPDLQQDYDENSINNNETDNGLFKPGTF